jgi:hypothetical protein
METRDRRSTKTLEEEVDANNTSNTKSLGISVFFQLTKYKLKVSNVASKRFNFNQKKQRGPWI